MLALRSPTVSPVACCSLLAARRAEREREGERERAPSPQLPPAHGLTPSRNAGAETRLSLLVYRPMQMLCPRKPLLFINPSSLTIVIRDLAAPAPASHPIASRPVYPALRRRPSRPARRTRSPWPPIPPLVIRQDYWRPQIHTIPPALPTHLSSSSSYHAYHTSYHCPLAVHTTATPLLPLPPLKPLCALFSPAPASHSAISAACSAPSRLLDR